MVEPKAGPWSKKDKQYISDQAGKRTPEEIAAKLGRNPKRVKDYMTKQGLMKYYYKEDLEQDQLQNIRKSRYWETLKKEFTDEELDSFEYHWQNIVRQFRDDILHTEELQIVDAIKLQIMMDRSQIRQKEIAEQIDNLKKKILDEEAKAAPDEKKLERMSRDISTLYSGIEAHSKDHVILLKEKNQALQKLKATREQRIQQIESSKETLVGWVKQLYTNPKKRYELGINMEKMRIATEAEYKRLSEYHTYADGTVDKPILNEETVQDWTDSTLIDTEEKEKVDTKTTEMTKDTQKQDKNA